VVIIRRVHTHRERARTSQQLQPNSDPGSQSISQPRREQAEKNGTVYSIIIIFFIISFFFLHHPIYGNPQSFNLFFHPSISFLSSKTQATNQPGQPKIPTQTMFQSNTPKNNSSLTPTEPHHHTLSNPSPSPLHPTTSPKTH
jgi:hypothetical protein